MKNKPTTTDVVLATANKIVDVRRALDAFNYNRKQHLSCTAEKTMQEIEQKFGNKRYAETERLIEIIKLQIARDAQQFKKDPKRFVEKYKMIRETILVHSHE